jgi:hypothetical protein
VAIEDTDGDEVKAERHHQVVLVFFVRAKFDELGNAYLITSYNSTTLNPGNIVDQVQRAYNGLGQLTTEYQSTNGAVSIPITPKVQYAYNFTSGGTMNNSRLTTLTYPNGRALTYDYSSGINDAISRLSSITDGVTLESYDYLGAGTVVRRGHVEPGVDLTYIKQTGEPNGDAGDQYIGLDRFGRIVDQRWRTSTTEIDRYQYGYDRNSSTLFPATGEDICHQLDRSRS